GARFSAGRCRRDRQRAVTTATLVVELLTEELPPKALKDLSTAFAKTVSEGLSGRGYLEASTSTLAYATPRRLAVQLTHVLSVSPDKPLRQKLMPANVAFDADGKPTMALRKRLDGLGYANVADLYRDGVLRLDGQGPADPGQDHLTIESEGKS